MEKYLFRPEGAFFGDCMPFFNDKSSEYYLYYQRDTRNPLPFGEPFGWNLLTTKDFVQFFEHGEVLVRGHETDQDQFIYAGSVFKEPIGNKIAYYTGYNRTFIDSPKPSQVLMQAQSSDGFLWEKTGVVESLTPQKGYDPDDWRDPFIIWDQEKQEYLLILGTRLSGPKKEKTGRLVYFTSTNCQDWEFKGDFWAPNIYTMIEMPEIVKIDSYWYLIYSEYDYKKTTHYCVSENLRGPWTIPEDDEFAGRAYYAARSVANENTHTLVGWVPSKEAGKDENNYLWGGTLLPLEIYSTPDHTLKTKLPESIIEQVEERSAINLGEINAFGQRKEVRYKEGLGKHYSIETTFSFKAGTKHIQFMFYQDQKANESYVFDLDVSKQLLRVERTPNLRWFQMMNIGLERKIALFPDTDYKAEVLIDDTIAVITIDGITLSCRVEKNNADAFSVAVIDGTATFTG
ncbi:beta-fructofuranosidase [Enterococcus avium]|uniref:family 43 glycosylhydrolase n=1 Tax=Enterococcus TaxID=1350 RepID=UPI00159A1E71|nr:family 43 glycosylhydrolase [Enterococcus devriesei]MBU5366729.1 family 43 glycosylhydrolase [Enterococcus devriesei]BBM18411.1 beta-fructofuranosidase [Enterococcus avium]